VEIEDIYMRDLTMYVRPHFSSLGTKLLKIGRVKYQP